MGWLTTASAVSSSTLTIMSVTIGVAFKCSRYAVAVITRGGAAARRAPEFCCYVNDSVSRARGAGPPVAVLVRVAPVNDDWRAYGYR